MQGKDELTTHEPDKKRKISGFLNNCAFNCALPIILNDIHLLAEHEKDYYRRTTITADHPYAEETKLEDNTENPISKSLYKLREIFWEFYDLPESEKSWERFNDFLNLHPTFMAKEIIFLPIFREFIKYSHDNLPRHLTKILGKSNEPDIYVDEKDNHSTVVIYQKDTLVNLKKDGKFQSLTPGEAYHLFYKYFGINLDAYNVTKTSENSVEEGLESKSSDSEEITDISANSPYQKQTYQRTIFFNGKCISQELPEHLKRHVLINLRSVSLYLYVDHYEITFGHELKSATTEQNQYHQSLGGINTALGYLYRVFESFSSTRSKQITEKAVDILKILVKLEYTKQYNQHNQDLLSYLENLPIHQESNISSDEIFARQLQEEENLRNRSYITQQSNVDYCSFEFFTNTYFQLFMAVLLIAATLTLTALLIGSGQLPTAIAGFIIGLSTSGYQALLGSSIAVIATTAPTLSASLVSSSDCGFFCCGNDFDESHGSGINYNNGL